MGLHKHLPFPTSVVTTLILVTCWCHTATTYYCNKQFCSVETAGYNNPCERQNCSTIGFRQFLDPGKCNCCQYCFHYLKLNDTCDKVSPQKPSEMCGPHLTCEEGEKPSDPATCQKMKPNIGIGINRDSCRDVRHDYEMREKEGERGIAEAYPVCDADGYFAPRQCLKGSVCYCSGVNGQRLFGVALPEEKQDCACSRDVDRLTREFGFDGRLPHCLPNGDYDELQCVVRACSCRSTLDEQHPIHEMNETKCYDPDIHIFEPETPRYYMRDCELKKARIDIQIAEAEENNEIVIIADMPRCDPDGNYAAIQTNFDRLYCADPNGTKLEDFEVAKFSWEAQEMNCSCARDRYLLRNAATGKPKCCANGNYRPWQSIGRTYYCVDQQGRQNMEFEIGESKDFTKLGCFEKKYEISCETD